MVSEELTSASPLVAGGDDDDWYDRHKRALTLAVLPADRYRRAFEPGCGAGALSELLAARCDEVVAWDADPACVVQAAARLADVQHVHVAQGTLPRDWPDGRADLVLLSEIGCFLNPASLDLVLSRAASALEPGGALVAVHRRTATTYYPAGGDDVHARLFAVRGIARTGGYADDSVRIDVFVRN